MKSAVVLPLLALSSLAGGLGGCARGGTSLTADAGDEPADADVGPGRVDAGERPVDAFRPDAPPPDAFVPDAYVPDAFVPDAFVPPPDGAVVDAFVPPPDACVLVNTQLLVNPAFDRTPIGTGWSEDPIDPSFPLVTADDGPPEQTAPYKAWLGGLEAPSTTVTDVLWQDVTIPAGTTELVLTGYYWVATDEPPSTVAYDTASLAVTQTSGTLIQTIGAYSNRTPTTAWTAFSHTFTQDLSGQTVRVRMTSRNDFLDATSFWWDTLALTATHCQ